MTRRSPWVDFLMLKDFDIRSAEDWALLLAIVSVVCTAIGYIGGWIFT